MNRLLYIPLSAALSLPISEVSRDWMQTFAYGTIAGEHLAPYQYRVLFAAIFYPAAELLTLYIAAWLFWFVCLAVLFLLMDNILAAVNVKGREYLLASAALIPPLIWFQPTGAMWSMLEGIFVAAALLALLRGKTAVLYPIVFLATLNRETAIFIPLMVLFTMKIWHFSGVFAVWGLTYAAVLWIAGPVAKHLTLAEIWHTNSAGPAVLLFVFGILLFGWLFWLAWKGWKFAPPVLRGAAVIIPAYVVLFAVFGVWYEWRWILALYPVLVTLAAVGMERRPKFVYGMTVEQQEVFVRMGAISKDVTIGEVKQYFTERGKGVNDG
jgi:hypothetical protein